MRSCRKTLCNGTFSIRNYVRLHVTDSIQICLLCRVLESRKKNKQYMVKRSIVRLGKTEAPVKVIFVLRNI